jgi:2-keto-4-pentenoate hydratase
MTTEAAAGRRRGDVFRTVLFAAVGAAYAVLMFPLVVLAALVWLAGKLLPSGDE